MGGGDTVRKLGAVTAERLGRDLGGLRPKKDDGMQLKKMRRSRNRPKWVDLGGHTKCWPIQISEYRLEDGGGAGNTKKKLGYRRPE